MIAVLTYRDLFVAAGQRGGDVTAVFSHFGCTGRPAVLSDLQPLEIRSFANFGGIFAPGRRRDHLSNITQGSSWSTGHEVQLAERGSLEPNSTSKLKT